MGTTTIIKYRFKTIGKNPAEIATVELFDRTRYQVKHEDLSKASIDTRYKYLKVMPIRFG